MKELPILFSTPMVKAIMEDRKTMTRRTYGLQLLNDFVQKGYQFRYDSSEDGPDDNGYVYFEEVIPYEKPTENYHRAKPQYQIGDKLWVRETFFDARKWKHAPLFADGPDFIYKADKDAFIGCHKWQPSLFLPKEAARIWLEVTGVRCERLMSITESDAIAEGVESIEDPDFRKYKEYTENTFNLRYPSHSFFSLWRHINGKNSVAANPWIFVYEFKRIERP